MKYRRYLLPGLVIAAIGLTSYQVVAAQTGADASGLSLSERISEAFNVDSGKVEEVVAGFHREKVAERQEQRLAQQEERLNKAVADGVITGEQKASLQAKHREMAAERQRHREEMRQWMEDNGIDPQALRQYRFAGRSGKFGCHKGAGAWLK